MINIPVMDTQEMLMISKPGLLSRKEMPGINFSHIRNLTDHTGIIQHAIYDIPNRKEGYCIDDNSRAMLLMVLAGKDQQNETARRLLPIYVGFVHYMQNSDGTFRNFMCYDRTCYEKVGSEDSFGRTLMSLGYLVRECDIDTLVKPAKEIFERAAAHCDDLVSIRGMANSIIGLCQYVQFNHPDDLRKEMVTRLADKMVDQYHRNRDGEWRWFESILSYDNAILPLALFHAYELTGKEIYLRVARITLQFLESKVFDNGTLRPVGNNGWLEKGGSAARFDQQGIDAMAMVLCYHQAYSITREKSWLPRMFDSFQWFLGKNDLELSLYDPESGGCADGLQETGINYNKGAESTLAYWISHMLVSDIIQK